MLQNLTGWHALLLIPVVLLLFGAARLPALARSAGQSLRILKSEVAGDAPVRTMTDADAAATTTAEDTPSRATPAPAHTSRPPGES